jgi:hypothetical protein
VNICVTAAAAPPYVTLLLAVAGETVMLTIPAGHVPVVIVVPVVPVGLPTIMVWAIAASMFDEVNPPSPEPGPVGIVTWPPSLPPGN